ncbi:hypothetical protein [Caldimonas sp. KR1-144]|uniref:hypothetical protein n=1 Tax=Caldimonas sp. KR1-144 TaxID=3400911 RepID=UPI003C0988A2
MATRPRRPPAAARDAALTREVLRGKRFLAADRAAMTVAEIATWDTQLLREHRLLVPIDVQALFVAPGDTEPMVRLPMLVAGAGAASQDDGLPAPFDPGTPRASGVHLHWAMPDALLRGTLADAPAGGANRLGLPALPDRWVVVRLLLPAGAREVVTTGWVLEADRAVAVPLAAWSEGGAAPGTPAGLPIARNELTGTVGGGANWCAVYDAVLNRFAFHDPLDDVAQLAPNGVDGDAAAYVVAGWWSDPALDPLDAARSDDSLDELLERLRWRLLHDFGDARWELERRRQEEALRKALGLPSADRWSAGRASSTPPRDDTRLPGVERLRAAAALAKPFAPIDDSLLARQRPAIASVFATGALEQFRAEPWHLRSTLLHGAVYGVPVRGAAAPDQRPPPGEVSVALGQHDDDLIAAFAAAGASADQLRATERLLAAFTAQKMHRLSAPDGAVELEEHEHAAAFASLPAGSAGNDRLLQRVQTGGAGGLGIGRGARQGLAFAQRAVEAKALRRAAPPARHAHPLAGAPLKTAIALSFAARPELIHASVAAVNDLQHSRVGDVLAATEARIVERPAPRWTFATDPLIGLRGARRSLRHGGDGRGSPDGKLGCRWPTHVIQELPGAIAPDRFVRSLGNGGVPREVLALLREAVLHDPYHDEWVAAAAAPPGADVRPLFNRLRAETLLRYGADGTYDGSTAAFSGVTAPRTARARAARATVEPGAFERQRLVADELRRFSLYKGADPDLVGVTTWSQPWVPQWLEWQLRIDGLDPPTLAAWKLDAVDLEATGAAFDGDTLLLTGRSLLGAGAAATLHDAIADWLAAEDALDAANAGLVDEATEAAYRLLDTAVRQLDLCSASLDGLRLQLLGFAVRDGLQRAADGQGGTRDPAPVNPTHGLLAGTLTLERARLLDAFGRTLELPPAVLEAARVPSRAALATRPGALALPPRLLRPARWRFRFVDASTAVGSEGIEARVDQVQPELTVNPVCGFVLPDHLDESLEVFGADGAPLGELLHEAASGGVVWEIAAGRTGPADAGPHHDLTPAQRPLADFAAALVAADAAARGGAALAAGHESALSALLRAIDTTLWTVDSFASLGSEHVAGLVGRPIAVVRAQLRLELKPPDDVDLSEPAQAAAWAAAEREARRHAFEVRIGELTRSDDGLLGFFVDDDFARFRLVDKAIAATAADAGRSRGKLELLGANTGEPPSSAIAHPYIAGTDDADTLALHLGQSVTLTLFMHPAGRVSLTSGILPRKALALARDWVGPGLAKLAPSLRCGPVLVETDLDAKGQVRLPKVSVFGKHQNFLWRDTPASWRSDAILAATQTALLPDTPAEFREGWIRVAPEPPQEETP